MRIHIHDLKQNKDVHTIASFRMKYRYAFEAIFNVRQFIHHVQYNHDKKPFKFDAESIGITHTILA